MTEPSSASFPSAEGFYRVLFENANDAIFIIDTATYRIVDANRTAQERLGYTREELIKMKVPDLHPKEEEKAAWEANQKLQAGGKLLISGLFHRRKDGGLIPVDVRASLIEVEGRQYNVAIVTDLTEKVQAEQYFRALFEKASDGLYLVDETTHEFVDVNQIGYRALGYTRDELLKLRLEDVASKLTEDQFQMVRDRLREGGGPIRIIGAHRRKDGSEFPVEVRISRILVGERSCMLAAARDITEQLRAGEELEEAKSFLEQVQESAGDGLVVVDEVGTIVSTNGKMAEMRELRREELVGRHLSDLAAADELDQVNRALDRLRQGEPIRLRTRRRSSTGRDTIFDITATPLERGGRKFAFAIVRDATEQVQVEEALRLVVQGTAGATGEDFFRSLTRNLASALRVRYAMVGRCLGDPPTRIRTLAFWAGEAFLDEMEYPLKGTPCEDVVKGDACTYVQGLQERFPHEQDLKDLHAEGYMGVPLKDAGQRIIGHLVVMHDAPLFEVERKMSILQIFASRAGAELVRRDAESALRKAHDELEQRVRERTAELTAEIAERQRTEETLRQSEGRFRLIAEAMPVAMAITRAQDGTILYANERAAVVMAVPLPELVGRNIGEFYANAADRPALRDALFKEGGVTDREFRLRRADGSEGWGMCSLRLTTHGGEPAVLGVFSDFTELKQAQEALRESEERFRASFAHGGIGMCLASPEGAFLQVNPALCEMVGYTEPELLKRSFIDITVPEDRERSAESARRMVEGGAEFFRFEKRYRHRDGRTIWAILTTTLLRDTEGKPLYFVSGIQDITERKRAEDNLRHAHDELERRVDARTAELARANAMLQEEIAERRGAEGALRESEARWRSLVANAPDHIMTVDREGRILSINYTVPDLTVDEVLGRSVYEFMAPESHDVSRAALDQVFRTGEPASYEVTRRDEGGEPQWFASRVGPVTREGQVVAAVIIASNVTEQKRAEQKLANLAAERGLLLAHTRDFVYRHGVDGVFTYMSPSVKQITGRTVDEWLTHYTEFLTDNPVNQKVVEITNETLRTGKQGPPYLVEVYHADGRRITLEVVESAYFEDGKIAGIVGVGRDVTERLQAEEALRFQKSLLESTSEAAIDGILVVSTEGKMVSFNTRFLQMWDLAPAVAEARSDEAALQSVLEKLTDPDEFLQRVQHLYSHPTEESHDEILLKDGRTLDRYSAPVRSQEGMIYGRVWYFRDVTGRKRTEEELRRAAEETRRAYEDMKRAQAQLIRSEKLASIGMLVSGVAHELNNPLNVMYGNLRLLADAMVKIAPLMKKTRGTPTQVRKVKGMIRDALKAAEHAREVVDDFRGFARDVRTAELVDLNRCLEEALTLLQRDIQPRIKLVRRFKRIPAVRCLRGQISQVFLNLLTNATEAIERKGTITLRTMQDDGRVIVEVADTGKGMPEDVRQKLFEPFFTTKPHGKGLGLGLSISAMIAQNHGGELLCRSHPGRGSVFRLELPVRS